MILKRFLRFVKIWNILPSNDLELWHNFVLACSYLCSSVITDAEAMLAHSYLLQFCKGFQGLYGKEMVTPNMHLHTHPLNCVLDFGPVYAFQLLSSKRYNGILGDYSTNQWAIEIQLMREFTTNQFMKDIPLPIVFREVIHPLIARLTSEQSGGLQEQTILLNVITYFHNSSMLVSSLLDPCKKVATRPVLTLYTHAMDPFLKIVQMPIPLFISRNVTVLFLMKQVKSLLQRFASCRFNGDLFGSSKSRGDSSQHDSAKPGDKIDDSGSDLRPGIVDFYMKRNIRVKGCYVPCILASVHRFQAHPARNSLGAPIEVWCKDLFKPEGDASFIPVQRIYGQFIPALDIVSDENVLVVCPLSRKLHC